MTSLPELILNIIKQNKFKISIATIISVLILLIVGVSSGIKKNADILINKYENNIIISIKLKNETTDDQVNSLLTKIKQNKYVKNAVLLSKEEVLKQIFPDQDWYAEHKDELFNPLTSTIEVVLYKAQKDPAVINNFKSDFSNNIYVEQIYYDEISVNQITQWINNLEFVTTFSLKTVIFVGFIILFLMLKSLISLNSKDEKLNEGFIFTIKIILVALATIVNLLLAIIIVTLWNMTVIQSVENFVFIIPFGTLFFVSLIPAIMVVLHELTKLQSAKSIFSKRDYISFE